MLVRRRLPARARGVRTFLSGIEMTWVGVQLTQLAFWTSLGLYSLWTFNRVIPKKLTQLNEILESRNKSLEDQNKLLEAIRKELGRTNGRADGAEGPRAD